MCIVQACGFGGETTTPVDSSSSVILSQTSCHMNNFISSSVICLELTGSESGPTELLIDCQTQLVDLPIGCQTKGPFRPVVWV